MKFNYQARTKTGKVKTGIIEASSKDAAIALLQKYGLFIVFLQELGGVSLFERKISLFSWISQKDIVIFSRQLSIMFKSKVPLMEALQILAKQSDNVNFREKLLKISEDIQGGVSFSQALSRHPKLFSDFYVNMVKAGEASGTLSLSLNHLADHLEREYDLSMKVTSAMIYPVFILVVMFGVILVMLLFVVPQITTFLEGTDKELPFLTKMIIAISDILKEWGIVIAIMVGGIFVVLFKYFRTKIGKSLLDEVLLETPLLGSFFKIVYVSRFAENLSVLVAGGLPITQALEITGNIVDNTVYKKIIFEVRDKVRKGGMVSSTLLEYPKYFPAIFTQMVLVGEKTGTLGSTLSNIVDFYSKEVDRHITIFLSILEPAMLLFLGLIVGGLVAAILMPLYEMTSF